MKKKIGTPEFFSRSFLIFAIIFILFIGASWKLFLYFTRTPVDAFFRDKVSFGILLIVTEKVQDKEDRLTFFSVATIYPKTQRIGFISFLPQTRMKDGEPTFEEKVNFTKPEDLADDISKLLNIPIPYHIKTNVEYLSQIVDLIEGVPFFMWSPALVEGEQFPNGEFILSGSMVRRILNPPVQNETKPAMDLFRYYTLMYNIWNNRDTKWELMANEEIFSIFTKLIESNLTSSELYSLGKKFGYAEGWHLTSIEIPVRRAEKGFTVDFDSTALFLKNFKKDLIEHDNPFLARMPRMEIKNGTEVSNLAKKIQGSIARKGIVVIEFSNADSHDYKNSILLDVAGNTYYLYSIAKSLNITQKYALINKSSFTDMTLILGRDYGKIKLQ